MDYNHVIENIGKVIDAAGVAVIVVGMLISTGAAVVELSRHETGVYRHFRQQLGRTILLGLELLVVGDIVRTVAMIRQPTLTSVAVLAIIVLNSSDLLSFSLEVELTGYWPWQRKTAQLPPERRVLPCLRTSSSTSTSPTRSATSSTRRRPRPRSRRPTAVSLI